MSTAGFPRDFRRLRWASLTESVGDDIARYLIPLMAVAVLGVGAETIGVLNALAFVPFIVVGPFIGAAVDRLDPKLLLVATDVVRAILLLSLPIAYLLGMLSVVQLFLVVALMGIADVFFQTSRTVLIPRLVERDQIRGAFGQIQVVENIARLGSPGIGAALLMVVAAPIALVTAAVSYVISATTLNTVKSPQPVKPQADPDDPGPQSLFARARGGMSYVLGHRALRAMMLSTMCINASAMILNAVTVVFAVDYLSIHVSIVAMFGVASACGGVLGAMAGSTIAELFGIGPSRITLAVIKAGSVLLVASAPLLPGHPGWWMGAASLISAFCLAASMVVGADVMPRVTPSKTLGSVAAGMQLFTIGIMPLASLTGGFLTLVWSYQLVITLAACITAMATVPLLLSPVRSWKSVPPEWERD